MKRRMMQMVLVMALMAVAVLAAGCVSNDGKAEDAADSAMSAAGYSGIKVIDNNGVGTSDSESHQMIAKMRLLSQGMSPELDDYSFVNLVKMTVDGSDEEIMVVVVSENGKETAILPENLEAPK